LAAAEVALLATRVAHPAHTTAPPPIPLAAAALRFLTGFKHAPNG
jgi:hypothetical protein